jgi:stage V sporulation protein AE
LFNCGKILHEVIVVGNKIKVILITDGDQVAQQVIEDIASSLNLRCISASAGNPTPISGVEIVRQLKTVHHDPVLIMFDDRGDSYKGLGERAMEYVASHPDVEVLGAVAVASNTPCATGVATNECITREGEVVHSGVDKKGVSTGERKEHPVVVGDTVGVLNHLEIPFIVGIGDIGKMTKADDIGRGAPITRKAIEEILRRSGVEYGRKTEY